MSPPTRRVTSSRPAGPTWRDTFLPRVLLAGGVALIAASCGTTSATSSTAAQAQSTATPAQTTAAETPSTAAMSARESNDVTIHTFVGQSLSNATYAIESPSAIVVIDSQYVGGDPEAFRAAIDAIGKPIVKVLITHDHPDHIGGLKGAFSDVPIASTAGVAQRLDHNDAVPQDRSVEVLADRFDIDGVQYVVTEFLDAEATAQMVIALPEHDAIFTGDLVFNRTHLFLTRHLDRWTSILEALQADSPSNVYPGHGQPGGPELYGATIDYIQTAQANLAASTSDAAYNAAMIAAYPGWKEQSLIAYYPRELLGAPAN